MSDDDDFPHKHVWKKIGERDSSYHQCKLCGIISKDGRFKKKGGKIYE